MRQLNPEMFPQLFGQVSDDPCLMLLTLEHETLPEPIYMVNNTENITSNGKEFVAFPIRIVLPTDDGESLREVTIDFDNVGLELIDAFRSILTPLKVTIDMILASDPDTIQISFGELRLIDITYNSLSVSARLVMDDFLDTEIFSERYTPSIYPGLFQ